MQPGKHYAGNMPPNSALTETLTEQKRAAIAALVHYTSNA
jgi:hypothetical protein